MDACVNRGAFPKQAMIERISLPERDFSTVSTCNQCSAGDCIDVCPTGAIVRKDDGVVTLDVAKCIGCGLCNMSCPYGGIMSVPTMHKSTKCDMCAHKDTPACVEACPQNTLSVKDTGKIFEQYNGDPYSPGLQFCAGCVMELVARVLLETLGDDVVLFGTPSCCVLSDKVKVPYYGTLMTNIASTASGVSRYFKKTGRETLCLALAGDGATADIGFGAVSAAAERNERMLYVCYDNEAYMNTGIQRSGTTPFGSWTNTTQIGSVDHGKSRAAKDVPVLIAEHGVPYAATATLAYMEDFIEKIQKAKEAAKHGFAYLHVFTPCPTGWKMPTNKAIEITRVAVETNYFPLWEAQNGDFRFTHQVQERAPIDTFIKYMKRFSHMDKEQVEILQGLVDRRYSKVSRLTLNNDPETL
ncbi:thiamine pyrophosphate-dependent enzyme [Pseudodesulfovibrio hydrargyri]|nr:thiamine pyrophosphate-dependent enzyme [Pseudodesulfovibrio hydrargyri]